MPFLSTRKSGDILCYGTFGNPEPHTNSGEEPPMDGSKFDELTRRLGRGVTRRNALKGIVATASGAVLARIGAEQAAARDVQVCHEGETISVPQEELNLRIRQGDQIRID